MTEAARPLVALDVQVQGRVAEVTLLGPGKGNAMGPDLWAELPVVFRRLDGDDAVRAVVLAGSGANFCFGLDLAGFASLFTDALADGSGEPGGSGGSSSKSVGAQALARTRLHDRIRTMQGALDAVAGCRKPVVAAIQGWCIGAGLDLIATCDVRYASADARFSLREVRMAIVADLGSLQRLPGIIADGHLRELALTGKDIDAARAAAIGLVNDVHQTPEAALAAAREFAGQVAANPPLVVQGIKQVLDGDRSARVAAGLKFVAAWNAAFLPSDDLSEAMAAFAERRPPDFQGH